MSLNFLNDPLSIFGEIPPERVVSLVPSWTDSMYDLGLGDKLIAVTYFCPRPAYSAIHLQQVGGPKTPDIGEILRLKPDLVLANREENSQPSIEQLIAAGLNVWLTFPKTVREMLDDLWTAASIFRSEIAMKRVHTLEKTTEWGEIAIQNQVPQRTFCPIWQDQLENGERWWMTFNSFTYSNDVLRICGGDNVFGSRTRRYPLAAEFDKSLAELPGERDTRYPRLSFQEIIDAQPDIILLPDEPFIFTEEHKLEMMDLFQNTPAGADGRIYLIQGSLLHWPGTRLAQALDALPALFSL